MHILSLSHCSSFCCSQTTPSFNTLNNEARVDLGPRIYKSVNFPTEQNMKGERDRIKEALLKSELSVSSYDTAWVAMVPSPSTPNSPCFPKCLEWILENQHHDGSWGLPHSDSSLIKDTLSSTLACILALGRWNVGQQHVRRGLRYIGSNFTSIMDKNLLSPIGFDIIFPGMIDYAMGMGLDLPMLQSDVEAILSIRDVELKRSLRGSSDGRIAFHAYVAEGLSKSQDWQEIMKYQKRNGSLFNSPSTTAAAVINTHDEKAFDYLDSLLQKFGNSVPTIYPLDIYTQLCIVDNLETFGISSGFSCEIRSILDKIYRCWIDNNEEITSDMTTCAMAFRILRMNGYDVSSDALARFDEVNHFKDSVRGHLRDASAVLEVFKASQIKILPNEPVLEQVASWSSCYLKDELSNNVTQGLNAVLQKVDYALKLPFYASLDRLEHKRNIEHYKAQNFQLLKTSYLNHSFNTKDVLNVAVAEFNLSQPIYRKELESLLSWVKENKLDQLEFARQTTAYCYFSTAATLFPPEMSDARISWAKNSVLATVVDDFFDVEGSREELLNLIMLVEKWDGNHGKEFCSKPVEILFSALYNIINEVGAKASTLQNWNVTDHIVEIWVSLLKSMMRETEWSMDKSVPTLDEYTDNGCVSSALGPIVLPAVYFVGHKLSEDIIRGPEYQSLNKLTGMIGRLLNDIRSYERESRQGKLNNISLHILHSGGSMSKAEANIETERVICSAKTELLRLVLREEGSVVPRVCKELFWNMSKVLHLFYMSHDEYASPKEMVSAVEAVVHEPLQIAHLQL